MNSIISTLYEKNKLDENKIYSRCKMTISLNNINNIPLFTNYKLIYVKDNVAYYETTDEFEKNKIIHMNKEKLQKIICDFRCEITLQQYKIIKRLEERKNRREKNKRRTIINKCKKLKRLFKNNLLEELTKYVYHPYRFEKWNYELELDE